ncbi:MAG: MmcQ/YjbR family DNA-binding protein [Anaerolineales bacterium]
MAKLSYEQVDTYFLAKPGTRATYPFDETTRVYKVLGRVYGLFYEKNGELNLTLKCDPDDALALRKQYQAIIPGYHTDKRHWNTLLIDGSLPESLVYELIDHSYDLVVKKLSKAKQKELAALQKGHI